MATSPAFFASFSSSSFSLSSSFNNAPRLFQCDSLVVMQEKVTESPVHSYINTKIELEGSSKNKEVKKKKKNLHRTQKKSLGVLIPAIYIQKISNLREEIIKTERKKPERDFRQSQASFLPKFFL